MISFQNKGLIDMRAVRTIGLNVKPGTESPMGEFGTGLKLGICVVLRNGGSVTILRGRRAYRFGSRTTTFRGEPVELVTMNGEDLGFVLNYGKNWKPWQAFREFYSNMIDEPEPSCRFTNGRPEGKTGYTTIVVEGAEFDELYENRRSVFLEGEPLLKVPGLEVYFGQSSCIYYNRMRAMDLPQPSLFTYSITRRMPLTEDRTFLYPHMAPHYAVRSLVASEDAEVIRSILGVSDKNWEGNFRYDLENWEDVSGTFMRVAADMKAARASMSEGARKLFTQRATATSTYGLSRLRQPTPVERAAYERALELIRQHLPTIPELPLMMRNEDGGAEVWATMDHVEANLDFNELSDLDRAAVITVALVGRFLRDKEPNSHAVARAFLLKSVELAPESKATPQPAVEDDNGLPF